MKIRIKTILLIAILSISGLIICGCESQKLDATTRIIMLGNHENSIKFSIDFNELLLDTYKERGQAYFICIDGEPTTEMKSGKPLGNISNEVYQNNPNPKFLEKELNKIISDISSEINMLEPTEPEVDVLSAFKEAECILKNDSRRKKEIVIYDSGLSTIGGLNFCTFDYFNQKTSDIIDELNSSYYIPNLKDVKVIWYGLGEVATPQTKLSNEKQKKLQEIWSAILKESGAMVEFNPIMHDGSILPQQYGVSVSVVECDDNIRKEIYFLGNSSNFSDNKEANKTIDEIVSLINKDIKSQWCIIGCTASLDKNTKYDYLTLSKERVEAVRNVLISEGISDDRLVFCALGFNNPWHINNLDDNNMQTENKAETNRKVVVISTNSREFEKYADIFKSNYFIIQ